jgi:hypothetical protein
MDDLEDTWEWEADALLPWRPRAEGSEEVDLKERLEVASRPGAGSGWGMVTLCFCLCREEGGGRRGVGGE